MLKNAGCVCERERERERELLNAQWVCSEVELYRCHREVREAHAEIRRSTGVYTNK